MSDNQRTLEDLTPVGEEKSVDEDDGVMNMSDEDLYQKLKEYDSNIGPVTRSTKKIYVKKLKKLLSQAPPPPPASSKNPIVYGDDDDAAAVNGAISGGGGDGVRSGDAFTSQKSYKSEITFKSSRVHSQSEASRKSSAINYFMREDGGGDKREEKEEEDDDDGGLVEGSDDDNDHHRLHSSFLRTYPTSFHHFGTTSTTTSEVQALLRAANETFSESNRSATDTLNSSFKYPLHDYSDGDDGGDEGVVVREEVRVDGGGYEVRRKRGVFGGENGGRVGVVGGKRVVGGSWCGVLLRLLVLLLVVGVVLLCVVVYKSMDENYSIVVGVDEWVEWCGRVVGGWLGWVKGLSVVEWVNGVVNEWVVWLRELELVG